VSVIPLRVSRKKVRNPLDLPWWAIQGFEWLLEQSGHLIIDDVLIEAWTLEAEDEVYIQFIWPGGKPGLVSISKNTPRGTEDMSSCDYFRGVGKCSMGCYTEPSCQTDRPEFGWPSERYKF
jgi:hypothetical protein